MILKNEKAVIRNSHCGLRLFHSLFLFVALLERLFDLLENELFRLIAAASYSAARGSDVSAAAERSAYLGGVYRRVGAHGNFKRSVLALFYGDARLHALYLARKSGDGIRLAEPLFANISCVTVITAHCPPKYILSESSAKRSSFT